MAPPIVIIQSFSNLNSNIGVFLLAETPSKFGGYPRVIKNEVKI